MTADLRARLQGALADRYVIERELGRGGMATVCLARDLREDGAVALKVLHPELGYTIGADRFKREIRVAARLHIRPRHRLRPLQKPRREGGAPECSCWPRE